MIVRSSETGNVTCPMASIPDLPTPTLLLDPAARGKLWRRLEEIIEA
jgi:hypothetical protein